MLRSPAPPLDTDEAKELIARTKAGVKNKRLSRQAGAARNLRDQGTGRSSNLIADANGRIASIDVNPFLINAKTGVAVDGLIVLNNAAARDAAQH